MKSNTLRRFFLILNFVFFCTAFGQTRTKFKTFNQNSFEKNKVFEKTYHLWWNKYNWGPIVKDTIPYFVDDRNYKGIINYGVEFKSRDFKVFTFLESKTMFFVKVAFQKCKLNLNDSIIEIEGYINGGWGDIAKSGLNKPRNYIEIFIGEKTDTVNSCYFNISVNKEEVDVKWKNKIIDLNQVLDTFPSFYFKKSTHFRTEPKGNRPFKIRAKVQKNTILAFGSSGCYSEIFDIGSMVYLPNKNRKNKLKDKRFDENDDIIINNKLVSDIEKEKQDKKEINYYTHTEKAENHILKRQYALAKESYIVLNKEYKTIYARDIHNAIRCAILSRDYKNAFYFGKKLAQKGIEKKYFNAKIFNALRKNIEWNHFITDYDSLYKENQSKRNMLLKQQIEGLVAEDQADYGLENRKESAVLYETTERVTDKLIDLLNREGFPSEEKIGAYTKNDTILISSPDYNVLIRHAVQQSPKKLASLSEILEKSYDVNEYDKKRSTNHRGFVNACLHVYKGNLYDNKSCGNNDLVIRKIKFMFNNPNNFIIDQGDFIVTEYNKEHPEKYNKFYEENFNFITKLTDDWEFYEH